MSTELSPNAVQRDSSGSWRISHPSAHPGGALFAVVAPWCGHCSNLKKNIAQAQSVQPFNFFFLDGDKTDINRTKTNEMGIQGFPTIYYVAKDGILKEYNGGRSAEALARNFSTGVNIERIKSPTFSIFSWIL
jgi:thioredoxin-like negative regulator of GroEL